MTIQTKYMSFKNCCTISSSYDFKVHQQHSQKTCCYFQAALLLFEVLRNLSPALSGVLLVHTGLWLQLPGMSPVHSWLALAHWGLSPAHQYLSPAHLGLSLAYQGAPKALSGNPRWYQTFCNTSQGTALLVIRVPSDSKCLAQCLPRVWYSADINPSKFAHQEKLNFLH